VRIHARHLHRYRRQARRRYRPQWSGRLDHARPQTAVVNGINQYADKRLRYVREEADEREALRAIATPIGMVLVEAKIDPGNQRSRGKHCRISAIQEANGPRYNGRNEHGEGNVPG